MAEGETLVEVERVGVVDLPRLAMSLSEHIKEILSAEKRLQRPAQIGNM